MNLLKSKLIIGLTAIILISGVVSGIILLPPGPYKPKVIPLGDYSYSVKYLDYQVNKMIDKYDLPSVCVAMIDDQNVIYKQAYGMADIEKNIPATLDTVYKMGSITKLFTGIEIMRCFEEGLLNLDSPITGYVPEFSINSKFPDSEAVTVRSLLAHHSGLPRNSSLLDWYWEVLPDTLENQVQSLAETYQAFPVGYRYKYSNIGYNLLGRLIEIVRGIEPPVPESAGGWPYYMNNNVLKPVGMVNSSFGSDMLLYGKESDLDLAKGYYWDGDRRKPHNQYDIIELASGNFQSTMNDMVTFVQYLFNIGETGEETIISKDTLWSMFEEQYTKPRDPKPQGLTWFTEKQILGELVVLHTGTNQGFKSIVALLPEHKLGFIAFSNGTRFEGLQNQLTFDMLGLMLETAYGIIPDQKQSEEKKSVSIETLEKYKGTYIINGETIEVILSGNQLQAVYQENKINMIPESSSKFRLHHWLVNVTDIEMEFFVDDPDEEDILVLYMGDYFVCPKYPIVENVPAFWRELTGSYVVYPRYPSAYSDDETMGTIVIKVENGILMTSDNKYLLPIDDTQIGIIGGIFDGETMIYDAETGDITWQNVIYKPAENQTN